MKLHQKWMAMVGRVPGVSSRLFKVASCVLHQAEPMLELQNRQGSIVGLVFLGRYPAQSISIFTPTAVQSSGYFSNK